MAIAVLHCVTANRLARPSLLCMEHVLMQPIVFRTPARSMRRAIEAIQNLRQWAVDEDTPLPAIHVRIHAGAIMLCLTNQIMSGEQAREELNRMLKGGPIKIEECFVIDSDGDAFFIREC